MPAFDYSLPPSTHPPREYQVWLYNACLSADSRDGREGGGGGGSNGMGEGGLIGANSLVTLETGKGKTLVASMVIKHFLQRSPSGDDRVVVVLAPTRILVEQQKRQIDRDVGLLNSETIHGESAAVEAGSVWRERLDWEDPSTWKAHFQQLDAGKERKMAAQRKKKEMERCAVDGERGEENGGGNGGGEEGEQETASGETAGQEVWVQDELSRVFYMTPGKLMEFLMLGFLPYSRIALLVFDEAHKCTGDADLQVIMKNFHRRIGTECRLRPRILGLTASPTFGQKRIEKLSDEKIRENCLRDIRDCASRLEAHVLSPPMSMLWDYQQFCYHTRLLLGLPETYARHHHDSFYGIDTHIWEPLQQTIESSTVEEALEKVSECIGGDVASEDSAISKAVSAVVIEQCVILADREAADPTFPAVAAASSSSSAASCSSYPVSSPTSSSSSSSPTPPAAAAASAGHWKPHAAVECLRKLWKAAQAKFQHIYSNFGLWGFVRAMEIVFDLRLAAARLTDISVASVNKMFDMISLVYHEDVVFSSECKRMMYEKMQATMNQLFCLQLQLLNAVFQRWVRRLNLSDVDALITKAWPGPSEETMIDVTLPVRRAYSRLDHLQSPKLEELEELLRRPEYVLESIESCCHYLEDCPMCGHPVRRSRAEREREREMAEAEKEAI